MNYTNPSPPSRISELGRKKVYGITEVGTRSKITNIKTTRGHKSSTGVTGLKSTGITGP